MIGGIWLALARIRALFRLGPHDRRDPRGTAVSMSRCAPTSACGAVWMPLGAPGGACRFGNPLLIQDRGYDVRGGGVLETIVQDVSIWALGQPAATRPFPSLPS